MYILNRLSVFCVMIGLSACQLVPPFQTGQLSHVPALHVAASPAEAQALAQTIAETYTPHAGTPSALENYSALTTFTYGQAFYRKANHRVMAIGHPKQCGAYYGSGPFTSLEYGIQRTLNRCLERLKSTGENANVDCGCRIAMINETVYLTPDDFSFRTTLPAVALVKDTQRGRQEILGYAVTTGRSGHKQPLSFHTSQDRAVCTGHYSITPYGTRGDAFFNCFDGQIQGPALFKVAGYHEGQPYGTILIKAGENELIMVYGLPTEEYNKRKEALIRSAGS